MTKRIRLAALAAAATTVPAVLSGCAASSGSSSDKTAVSVVGFSVLKTANEPVIADFQKTDAGKGVKFTTSYGASGDQSRAVIGGLHADEVHLSLEPDVVQARRRRPGRPGLGPDPTKGILTDSEVVFLVRKGNPLGHQDAGTTWSSPASRSSRPTRRRPARRSGTSWPPGRTSRGQRRQRRRAPRRS